MIVEVLDTPDNISLTNAIITPSNANDCSPDNGQIAVTDVLLNGGSDGTANYDFNLYESDASTLSPITFVGATVSGLAPGVYFVEAVDNTGTGCSSNLLQVTIADDAVKPAITIAETAKNTICDPSFGGGITPTGSLTATITAGAGVDMDGSYTFEWFQGTTGTMSAINDGDVLANGSDVTIANDLNPATPPHTSVISGLVEGTYWVRLTDTSNPNNNCTATAEFTLTADLKEVEILAANITLAPDVDCSGNDTGSITVEAVTVDAVDDANVATNFTVEFFDAAFAPIVAPITTVGTFTRLGSLAAGTYYVRATRDATGCVSDYTEVTIIADSIEPDITATVNPNTFCDFTVNGSGDITLSIDDPASPGTPRAAANYNFQWYEGSGILGANFQTGAGLNSAANLKPGFYTIVVTTIDNVGNNGLGRGCSDQVIVQVKDTPNQVLIRAADITKTNSQDCNPAQNGTITVNDVFLNNVSNGTGGYTFKLFNNAFTDISGTYAFAGNVVSSLPSGTYYVQATSTSGSGCNSNFRQVIINDVSVKPTPSISQVRPNTYCDPANFDGSLTVTIGNNDGGAYLYQWHKGSIGVVNPVAVGNGGQTATISNVEDGQYWVRVTDNTTTGLNCAATATFNLQYVPVVITLQASSADDTSCDVDNGSVFFNGTTDFVTITSSGNPADNATVNGLAAIDASYTFQLYNSSFALQVPGTLTTASLAAVQLPAGRYYVVATHKTFLCASAFYPIDIDDDTVLPIIASSTITPDTSCDVENGSIQFVAETNGADGLAYVLTWYSGQNTSGANITGSTTVTGSGSSADPYIASNLAAGFYTVMIEQTPGSGCETVETFQVFEQLTAPSFVLPASQLTHSTLCVGVNGSFRLDDDDIVSTGIGATLSNYTWSLYPDNSGSPNTGAPIALGAVASPSYDYFTTTGTGLAPGTYYLQAESTLGCESAFIKFSIEDFSTVPAAQVSVVSDKGCDTSFGVGEISVVVTEVDGTPEATGYVLVLKNSGGTTIVETSTTGNNAASYTGLASGVYTLTATNNRTGCVLTQDIDVPTETENVLITSSSVVHQTTCDPNGSVTISEVTFNGVVYTVGGVNNLLTNFTFTWSGPNGSITPAGGSENMISNLEGGSLDPTLWTLYSVQVEHITTGCTMSVTGEFPVYNADIVYPDILIDQVAADQSCTGGTPSGILSATVDNSNDDTNPNYTFEWFTGSGAVAANSIATTSTISNLTAGLYTVSVRNLLTGCNSLAEFDLASEPWMAEIDSADIVITAMTNCSPADGTIEISAISPGSLTDYTYSLYDQDPADGAVAIQTSTDGTFTGVAAGQHFIEVIHNTTNCAMLSYVEVEVPDESVPPVISLVDMVLQTNCNPAIPNGAISVSADGSQDTGAYTFSWFRGSSATGTPLVANNPQLLNIAAGQYTVLVVNNTTGCSQSKVYRITDESINPLEVTITATRNDKCLAPFDGVVAANLINIPFGKASSDYKFVWNAGQVPPSFDVFDYEGQAWEGLNSGIYTLMVFNRQDPLCATAPIQVLVEDATSIPAIVVKETQPLTICYQDRPNGELTASLANGTVTGHTFEWYIGSLADPAAKIFDGPIVNNLAAGPYTLRVTNSTTGCQSTQTVEVTDQTVPPSNPTLTLVSNMTSCAAPNGEARATVEGNIGNYRFEWYEATDTNTIIYTGFDPKGLGREGETVEYIVIATDLLTGCVSEESRISISDARTEPQFVVDVQDSQCLVPTGVALLVFPEPVELDSVVWTHLATGNTTFEGGLFEATFGDYSVTIWDGNGCTATQEFTIGADIVIYNGVSANGDGLNDFFIMDCIDQFPNNNVKIFNRAGAIVWENDGYDNTDVYFDGVSNKGIVAGSRLLPAGTYFYLVDKGDGTDPLSGYLELVR